MYRKTLYGFFIQNGIESLPVRIERYPFGEWLNIYFQSLFAEKPEVSELWIKPTIDKLEKNRLIEEATEYYFLSLFASWFDVSYSQQGNWKIFKRKEILHLFSSNRFLDLFTQPMEERPIFANEHRKENVLTYFSRNGSGDILGFYEDFCLQLPQGSCMTKHLNWLVVETPSFNLRVLTSCDGCSTFLPIDFAKYYLGFRKNCAKNVHVKIQVRRRLNSYLFPKQRKLIKDLKEFLEYFEENISSQNFLAKHDWEAFCIQARMIEGLIIK